MTGRLIKLEFNNMENKQKEADNGPRDPFLTLVSWEASEYEHFEKSSDWYWAVGIIACGFFIVAIILKNFLFAIISILGGFGLALYGSREPKIVSFAITSRGLKIDNNLFTYDTLKSFWLNYDPPHVKELYVISKKAMLPQITIPLGKADPNEIREHLIKFIEEKHTDEPLSHIIARFLRF